MIHPIAAVSSTAGGGGAVNINFTPPGGNYSGTQNVGITITNATRFRWWKNNGAKTTVEGTTTTVSVPNSNNTLHCEALDASSNVLATRADLYEPIGGGG